MQDAETIEVGCGKRVMEAQQRCTERNHRETEKFSSFTLANEHFMWSQPKVNVVDDKREKRLLKSVGRYEQSKLI